MQIGYTSFGIRAWLWDWNSNGSLLYKVFNRRPPMFSCIRLRKRQQCYELKIGGKTPITNKFSSISSIDQIQYRAMYQGSIM